MLRSRGVSVRICLAVCLTTLPVSKTEGLQMNQKWKETKQTISRALGVSGDKKHDEEMILRTRIESITLNENESNTFPRHQHARIHLRDL